MNTGAHATSMSAYRGALTRVKQLDREEERRLSDRWAAGDQRAGARLVEGCLPFVVSIAVDYRRWGVPLDDLIQQGNLGLLRAARKFDTSRDCRLATYASYWIRAEIRELVVRAYRIVRVGTTKSERRALRHYRTTREADPAKLAEASGLTVERAARLLPVLAAHETSLDANTNGGTALAERTAATGRSPEEDAQAAETRDLATAAVRDALDRLNDRERMIVQERLMADDPVTLHELGLRLGVSKERVRQLEERACGKLRSQLRGVRDLAFAG
jgi:RNA polymerase sigma-32 factor